MKPNRSLFICIIFSISWLYLRSAHAIVGYVNVALKNGYTFVANPLNKFPNTLTNVIPLLPDNSRAYVWDVTNQVFLPPATFDSAFPGGWDNNYDVSPGKGFVLWIPQNYTNTFVGEVLTGASTNFVPGTNKYSLLGSKIPQTGSISSALGFPGSDGDHVYFFRTANQRFSDAYTYHGGYGWFDPNNPGGAQGTGDPVCNVAESFFVQNPGPNMNWVQTLNPLARASSTASVTSTERQVSQIMISERKITLKLQDPGGGRYDVQFSADGLAWTTVAINQSGATWTGKLPDAMSGYFQIITSQTERSVP